MQQLVEQRPPDHSHISSSEHRSIKHDSTLPTKTRRIRSSCHMTIRSSRNSCPFNSDAILKDFLEKYVVEVWHGFDEKVRCEIVSRYV